MPRFFNPRTTARPSSKFSHGVVHSANARRLVIAGQVGVRVDGEVEPTLEGQMEAAWDNLVAVLEEAGMGVSDLIRITAYATVPGSATTYRAVRDRRLMGHKPTATYLEVVGLARPDFLFEIEGEAVVEDEDRIADGWTERMGRAGDVGARIRSKENG